MSEQLPFANKTLGQHWLTDETILQDICDFAEIAPGDVVLEIGPGTGTLTDRLIAGGAEVIALEYDKERAADLRKKYAEHSSTQIFIQEGDIRTYDFGNLPEYKIVANIPYYVTAYLLRRLTETNAHKPISATLLVQKEVAERLAAQPGDLSISAIAAQFFYEVELGVVVGPEYFTPPPKVDSQVVKLIKREQPLFDVDQTVFFRIVKAGFSEKRKKLRSSLSGGLRMEKTKVEVLLEEAGIDPNQRAQELSLKNWYDLYVEFKKTNTNKNEKTSQTPS